MRQETQIAMITNYRLLMEEAKKRISVLNILLSGKTTLPNPALQEFGFLQLRIICELLALACLTAHGEMPEARSKSIRDEWNATNIMKRLETLHPDYYPTPIQIRDDGPGQKHVSPTQIDVLTKAELPRLYGRCSEFIHRGSITTLLKSGPRWPTDTKEITQWGQKLMNLLANHWIGHVNGETHILCVLFDEHQAVNVAFLSPLDDEPRAEVADHQQSVILPGLHPSKPWKPS